MQLMRYPHLVEVPLAMYRRKGDIYSFHYNPNIDGIRFHLIRRNVTFAELLRVDEITPLEMLIERKKAFEGLYDLMGFHSSCVFPWPWLEKPFRIDPSGREHLCFDNVSPKPYCFVVRQELREAGQTASHFYQLFIPSTTSKRAIDAALRDVFGPDSGLDDLRKEDTGIAIAA